MRTLIIAIISFLLSVTIVGGGALLWTYQSESTSLVESFSSSIASLSIGNTPEDAQAKQDQLRILIAGVGGKGHPGSFLTDTLIVAEIDNTTKSINLISIPRDLLVYTEDGYYQKINSIYTTAYQENKDEAKSLNILKTEVEDITGVSIDHYARVDFQGFKEIVNTFNGITVTVEETIDDPYYPDGNYGYDPFYIEEGTHTLKGERALKYARTRYTSDQGDFDRAKRQQQVINKLREKFAELNPVWDANKVFSLAKTAKENLKTDLSIGSIRRLYTTYQDIDTYSLNSLVIGRNLPQSTLKEDQKSFGGEQGYVLLPRAGEENYLAVQEKIQNIGNIEAYEQRKQNVQDESPSLALYSDLSEADTEKIQGLLEAYGISVKLRTEEPPNESDLGAQNTLYMRTSSQEDALDSSKEYLSERFDIRTVLTPKRNNEQTDTSLSPREERRIPPREQTEVQPSEVLQDHSTDFVLFLRNNPF